MDLEIREFHIPRWKELPAIGLYMEQVITLINGAFDKYEKPFGMIPVTKNMINNYVKARIVTAPVNRQYPRKSLAMIVVLQLLKNCYTTEEIDKLIRFGIGLKKPEATYDRFCDAIERAVFSVFTGKGASVAEKAEKQEAIDVEYVMEQFALSVACKYFVNYEFADKLNLRREP